MLVINYTADGEKRTISFPDPAHFVAELQLEVPPLQDYYRIENVTVSKRPVTDFKGRTVVHLFDYFLNNIFLF